MAYFDVDRRRAGSLEHVSGSQFPPPGEKHAGEYIVSGIPFVSSSTFNATTTYEMKFPALTQWIFVQNLDEATTVDFGFTAAGIAGNQKWTVQADEISPKLEVRTRSIYLKGTDGDAYQVVAGLTQIPSGSVPDYENNAEWGI